MRLMSVCLLAAMLLSGCTVVVTRPGWTRAELRAKQAEIQRELAVTADSVDAAWRDGRIDTHDYIDLWYMLWNAGYTGRPR